MFKATFPFGKSINGTDVHLYVMGNDAGMSIAVSDLGADLVSVRVPDGRGNCPDVLLGYDGVAGYQENRAALGAIVGRCANRTAGARFLLAGTSYRLSANEGPNNLHSGPRMFYQRVWRKLDGQADNTLSFELMSQRGDQGFPGAVNVIVSYTLTEDNRIEVSYKAMPTDTTIINLTSHAYWNLNGHASGSVLGHTLCLDADGYTPTDDRLIPTGEIADVTDTPLDFRTARTLASSLGADLDHNFALKPGDRRHLEHAARLVGDVSGIAMDVFTDLPGLQVYASGVLDEPHAKDGASYGRGDGIALETQFFPDAIHHKNFEQPVFTTMRPYVSRTVFAFSTTA